MFRSQQVQMSWQRKRLQVDTGTGYLYLDRLKELHAFDSVDTTMSHYARKLNCGFMSILKPVCCIDLSGKTTIKQNARQRPKATPITRLVLSLYCLFTCHVIACLYYQYSYDLNLVGLMVARNNFPSVPLLLRRRQSVNQTSTSSVESIVESITQSVRLNGSQHELNQIGKMEASRKMLSMLGSPESTNNIVSEAVHLYLVIVSLVVFGLLQAYYRYVTPFDLYQFREQFNPVLEHEAMEQLVKEVVASYCKSNELLAETLLKYRTKYVNKSSSSATTNANAVGSLLLMMLTSGSLVPANQSRYWFRMRAKLMLCSDFLMLLFSTAYFTMLAYASWDIFLMNPLKISSSALMMAVSLLAYVLGTGALTASIDQIVLVNKIGKLIRQCIQVNSAEFASYTHIYRRQFTRQQSSVTIGGGGGGGGGMAKIATTTKHGNSLVVINHRKEAALKMNANLLFTLMHYKIFVRQLRPIKRTLDPSSVMAWTALIVVPICIRLHMPYMKLFQAEENRFILAAICLSLLFPVDCVMFPLLHLNTRCARLYRELSSLAAHILDIESKQGWSVYDSHAVLTLLKELSYPDRFLDQFVTRYAGLSGTYSTLVKVHFWWGLVIISILIGTQSNGAGLFDSFLSDPFGAFSSEG